MSGLGQKNIKNLPAMVEAGMITQAEADELIKKSKANAKKKKSLLKK